MSTKITELTQLVGTPSDTDVILITDVSEDASKQITVADLLSGTSEVGSFVFDSATINTTGNANVTFMQKHWTSLNGAFDLTYIEALIIKFCIF